jgi:rubrerythrin
MSETEHEQTEGDEATETPVSPETVIDDEEADEEAETPEEGAQEPTEPSQPPVDAAKEQRRIAAALKREHEAHDRKLEKILGEAHEHVLACPLCGDGLQGYVFPMDGANLTDEERANVLAFIGGQPERVLRPAKGVHECDVCDGWGQLAFPTKVPHVTEQMCPKCSGQGYVLDQAEQTNVAQFPTQPQTASGGEGVAHTVQIPDVYGRPYGHPHYGVPPAQVGG